MSSFLAAIFLGLLSLSAYAAEPAREIAPPSRFSVEHMDRSVDPGTDFYRYASGNWLKQNPVPPDKSSWDAFALVEERNLQLLQDIVETSARDTTAPLNSPARQVGDFYRSAVNTNRLEQLGFKPLATDFARIAGLRNKAALPLVLAELNLAGASPGMFGAAVEADDKNSSVYMFSLSQGGLGLPERDYYLADEFTKERAAYVKHIARMFKLAGEWESSAQKHAVTVLALETALAQASKSGVELRDPLANYHPFTRAELAAKYPALHLGEFMTALGLGPVRAPRAVVRQPEFFATLNRLVQERSLSDWKTYLRWHVLNDAAHYLNAAADRESFSFYGSVLSGQPEQRARWQRAVGVIDGALGEALGQLYVEKHYPPAARARMNELVENLKAVFHDRLKAAGWMAETTRAKALAKFDRFTQKIGSPEKFRDYSSVEIRPDDYFGNVRRAAQFDTLRELGRIGSPVDRTEWEMTPPTVNAYFNPLLNEIAFPAGILQPPFFDAEADDAVNYGAIGMVIGHEITHGYDDEGRQYDANGNLSDWWTEADAKEFVARAQKLIDQYDAYQALPGVKVNGKLTLGENIADLGGATIAYEALQRALAKDPSKRRLIDGFTPEQRFFLSFAQIWRVNQRDADLRQQVTANPHSPGQFRAVGPLLNLPEFYTAFGIKEGSPLWRAPASRARIW